MDELIRAYNELGQIYVRGEDAKRMATALYMIEEALKKVKKEPEGGEDVADGD